METLLIQLDSESPVPLYAQIYRHIVGDIRRGRLETGRRLPSKRALCQGLGVSQSTVETAYGILCAEGYVEARARSGFYVRDILPLPEGQGHHLPEGQGHHLPEGQGHHLPEGQGGASPTPEFEPESEFEPKPESGLRYDFSTGAVDTTHFPYATWAKITRETVYQCPHLLGRGEGQGEHGLRQALAEFLYQHRGVRCTAGQVVIGAGVEYLIDLLLSLLPQNLSVALEDPGYPVVWHTARRHGLAVCPIPVDEGGMSLEALGSSPADLAFVTPSHQFPMGCTMPAGRRSRLLAWAAAAPGRYIVEDDYDSEFRYGSRPIPALQGMDTGGRVVYLGTFSRGLAPGIRAAYMVLPHSLLPAYHGRRTFVSSTVSRLEQEALARFIRGGHYARHLRRAGTAYRRKQQALVSALAGIPGAEITGDQAGLHFLLGLPGREEGALVAAACRHGIHLHGLSRYGHSHPCRASTLVLGFAGLREADIGPAVARLRQAWC